jgi:hypothetical protein
MGERKPYPSDLSDERWALIEPVITAWKTRHPSVSEHQGRYAMREMGGEQGVNAPSALPAGTWTHVAVTLQGNLCILYVNHLEAARNSAVTLRPSGLGATTANYLGRSQYADPYLNSQLDDFRLYSRALTAGELGAL